VLRDFNSRIEDWIEVFEREELKTKTKNKKILLGAGMFNWCSLIRFRYSFICVKVPRPGDSEATFSGFESSCHLLLPV